MAETNVDLHKHAHKHTQTEKVVQGTLPSYAIRYEEAFDPWKTKNERLSAARYAHLVIIIILWVKKSPPPTLIFIDPAGTHDSKVEFSRE